ncbi:L10-interacting MYB domain-containing protein-like [Nicotiana tomentosiformis]|uniref:L10-interacting MYB domain-containing protein-like n=1 Tax=Nicotiana tomentosiformis TaxID=4098 RepID=UPI00051C2E9E|nr:L10-interacting MYB domain-containing protein-like [Nicotiana tomentosiformis]XP_009623009.1 L10-interacting MYB domain-containing protein-like [Nicotiana tomentosiformis]XP_018632526.1 L10-interacting MYB domain-containing protein-like [Nicotiana tomentosiformis]
MDSEANEMQHKQERLRTRWTPSLDKVFADLVVEQIKLGNRPNNVFDKKTWNYIRDEFNRQTNLNFNNNQLRKHLDVLRTRYCNLKSASDQNDALDDSCYIGFDLWEDIGAQPKPESSKPKECPIYEQLCTIFADSGAVGKYAQSSHYEGLDKSAGLDSSFKETSNLAPVNPSSPTPLHSAATSQQTTTRNVACKKRKCSSDIVPASDQSCGDKEIIDSMAEAMREMIAASKLQTVVMPQVDGRFSILKCVKALDEIEGIPDHLYYAALDLFDNPSLREMFVSLNSSSIRLTWLQGKCANLASFI